MAERPEDVQSQEEEEDSNKPAYKPPAQKSVKEILDADKDDESLQKYKQTLLGTNPSDFPELFPGKKSCVLKKMLIKVVGRPDLEIDLQDESQLKNMKFEVKEGVEYQLCIKFSVQKEILSGLKLVNKVSRGISGKEVFMVGSYAPNKTKDDEYEYTTAKDTFPSGMLARGEYKVSSLFTDDDKTEYCKWDWSFKIKKDWKD